MSDLATLSLIWLGGDRIRSALGAARLGYHALSQISRLTFFFFWKDRRMVQIGAWGRKFFIPQVHGTHTI